MPEPGIARATLLPVDSPVWAEVLRESPHDFYHLPSYVELCARHEGGEPGALFAESDRGQLLLPLIVRRIPGGGLDAMSPYGYPGPLVAGTNDPGFPGAALRAGMDLLRTMGVVTVFVRLHPLLNPVAPEGVGTIVEHGETVSVDLALSEEALWAQTRLNHRRAITSATRLGWVARMDDRWEHLDAFKRLYRATMERRSAATYYFFDDAYFDDLRAALGDRLVLSVVEAGGDVAAAALFVETSGIVQYHLSGADAAFAHVQPTKLLIHFVCTWARERGDTSVHLGGGVGAQDDSLLLFKAGFSPLRHPFRTLRIVVDEGEYRRLVAVRDPTLDPDARDGFFPLYRRT
jgi:hypothetical protein